MKRFLSLLLAMAMLGSFCPAVMAADAETVVYTDSALQEAVNDATSGETVRLGENITLTEPLSIGKGVDVTLDLNGHILTVNANRSVIKVDGGSLTMVDSGDGGKITGGGGEPHAGTRNNYYSYGGGVYIVNGSFTMKDGTISENTSAKGGGVYVKNGKFIMEGGTISENTATGRDDTDANNVGYSGGGGVYIDAGGEFIMESGTISKNNTNVASSTGGGGGGVFVYEGGKFTMEDGTISENINSQSNGGGVCVYNSTFTMNDGIISKNDAVIGGGVYGTKSTFTMDNGTISENTANTGGGVYLTAANNYDFTFTMKNGTISKNSAVGIGGGVQIMGGINFIMENGTISGNTADNMGGGVHNYGRTFTMKGGTISGNTAPRGGAVSAYASTSTMEGGTISGNTASNGGGMYIYDSGKFTMGEKGVFYGNTASEMGDDFYVGNNTESIKLIDIADKGWILPDDNNLITGWYLDNEGARWDSYNAVEYDSSTQYPYGLKAAYSSSSFTVTYDPNGGQGGPDEVTGKRPGDEVTLDVENKPNRDGYVFLGWSATKQDDCVTSDPEADVIIEKVTIVDSDITVYAVWAIDIDGNDVPDYIERSYNITLQQATSVDAEPSGWEFSDEFGYVENFSYLSYITVAQNLTDSTQMLSVVMTVDTDTVAARSVDTPEARILNIEQIDGIDVNWTPEELESDIVERDDWTYNKLAHTITWAPEEVKSGGSTKNHIIRTSVPAVNSLTTYTGVSTLKAADGKELEKSNEVRAMAFANWLRILVYVGNVNAPTEQQKNEEINFTVRLDDSDVSDTDITNLHYMFFESEDAYGTGAGELCDLELEPIAGTSVYEGTITLKNGQRVVIYDLAEDYKYEVIPALEDSQNNHYAVYSTGTTGAISDGINMAIFRLLPVYNLTVTKDVVGSLEVAAQQFEFDITLDVQSEFEDVNGYSLELDMNTVDFDDISQGMENADNNTWNGTFVLTGQEGSNTKTYTGIPDGTTYIVSEHDYSKSGYDTKVTVNDAEEVEGRSSVGLFNGANVNVGFVNVYSSPGDDDEDTYKLIYDPNGGNGGPEAVEGNRIGDTVILDSENKPTRDGYIFLGWSETKQDDYTTSNPEADVIIDEVTFVDSDITVYAVWAVDESGNNGPVAPPPVKDEDGNDVPLVDENGDPKEQSPVAPGTKFEDKDGNEWEIDDEGNIILPDDENGNPPIDAEYEEHDDDEDGIVDRVVITPHYPGDDEKDTYKLTYDPNGGNGGPETVEGKRSGDKVSLDSTNKPTRSGYTFLGWSESKKDPYSKNTNPEDGVLIEEVTFADSDITVYAVWQVKSTGGGGGGGGTTRYTLTYNTNGGTSIPSETFNRGTTVTLSAVPKRDGYEFAGWYSDAGLTTKVTSVVMNSNITVYAAWEEIMTDNKPGDSGTGGGGTGGGSGGGGTGGGSVGGIGGSTKPSLNTTDHFAYVIGYDDETVKPEQTITRAEVSTIFFRLLDDASREKYRTTVNPFEDVTEDGWYNTAISTMANAGILLGYDDGLFRPDAPITRAEYAAIAARFDSQTYDGSDMFSDISGLWASEYINRATALDWINGYEDGTFRPDQYITRAEAMALVNRVLGRKPSADHMLDDMIRWSDNANPDVWYYADVEEATNSHDYDIDNEYETWTKMRENRQW